MNTEISKAVMFTKEHCSPCIETKDYIKTFKDELLKYLVVLQKEHHSALVAAYELEKFPTLLLLNSKGEEVRRLVGGKDIQREIHNSLYQIYFNDY